MHWHIVFSTIAVKNVNKNKLEFFFSVGMAHDSHIFTRKLYIQIFKKVKTTKFILYGKYLTGKPCLTSFYSLFWLYHKSHNQNCNLLH